MKTKLKEITEDMGLTKEGVEAINHNFKHLENLMIEGFKGVNSKIAEGLGKVHTEIIKEVGEIYNPRLDKMEKGIKDIKKDISEILSILKPDKSLLTDNKK